MMTMIPYRTNREMSNRNTHDSFRPFADDFFRAFFEGERPMNTFRVDVEDKEDHFLLSAELPGVKKEDLRLELQDGVLTISAEWKEETTDEQENRYVFRERRTGSVSRSFNVEGIREEDIQAAYCDGVLKLTLPKRQQQKPEKRTITIA